MTASAPPPTSPPGPVRLLLLDDSPSDIELVKRELGKLPWAVETLHVATPDEFVRALRTFRPDAILSDHSLPGFSGRAALSLAQSNWPDAPFILVTGSLDEETAVDYMRAGASDYVLKERLVRLPSAVVGALERRQDRVEREQAQRKYYDIIDSAPVGIVRADGTGRILEANPAFARLLGFDSADQVRDLNMIRDVYVEPDARDRWIAAHESQGAYVDVETQWKKRDGTPIWVQLSGRFIRDEAGAVRYYESFVRDVTERRHLEEQLRRSQRIEAIGQLAGGVAHDFNNVLTAIIGYADLMLEDLPADSQHHEDVAEIRKAAERAAALTRQLLAFSRKQVQKLEVLDLNSVVQHMDSMLRRLIGEDVELRTILDTDLGAVRADAGQLEQVLMNLAVNARDAMPDGGKLTVETANIELDAAYTTRHAEVTTGSYVMLAVSDNGTGMDEATRAKVFEPFFTTKGPGKGTGLGLSTVYGIVKQSGGYIWVYSEPQRGATFKIYLPRVQETPTPIDRGRVAPEVAPGGTETILLAEDNEGVRALAERVLTARGYTVLAAARGVDALRLAKEAATPIALLLTDVVMPEFSGRELARRLAAEHSVTRVLYMSGYTDDAVVHHGVLEAGLAYLQKPFTPDALLWKVREVLDLPGMPR